LRKSTPKELAALPEHELQQAILGAMLERSRNRMGGMVNRHQPAAEIINDVTAMGDLHWQERTTLSKTLERNFRRAFDSLEQSRLIETDFGMNGAQGGVVLTPEGKQTAEVPVNFDVVRIRARLTREMLHPKLRGKPYNDFANGDPTAAIGGLQDPRHRGAERRQSAPPLRSEPHAGGFRPRQRTAHRHERDGGDAEGPTEALRRCRRALP
jgi:hypothetical protein